MPRIKELYDVIFDFSASPIGGGQKRLVEYVRFFNSNDSKVLFLGHPATRTVLEEFTNVNIDYVKRPPWRRILTDANLVDRYRGKARCFFSYGIPIYRRMSELDWLHVSNTLPFAYNACTLSNSSRLKNRLLYAKFWRAAANPDIVSAESQFSLDLYRNRFGPQSAFFLLRNGAEPFSHHTKLQFGARKNQVVTVGLERYKRIDRVVAEWKSWRAMLGADKLVIVGKTQAMPSSLRRISDIVTTGFISRAKLDELFVASRYYLSASEIENSSVAVTEAVCAGMTCILSRIPSHMEMFGSMETRVAGVEVGSGFFVGDYSMLLSEQKKTWHTIICEMCERMGLKTD